MPGPSLIMLTNPHSPAAEAYRTLRTNLMFYGVDRPARALVFTSPVPGQGASTALANLAVSLAQGGHDTIVIDSDLRRPIQHTLWGIDNARGLTTMLLDDAALANPPLQDVGVERLRVLTSGPLPPNPADLVGSKRMDDVIAALRQRADYVLFDAPPVLAVSDAAVLGHKLDGLILVLRAGTSRRDHAARAKEELERVNVPVLGVVLVNSPRDTALSRYYAQT
ncbi:MAG: CpsD/CapB family tyrosine-protein kinase [Aggregatilineaceae bacterium]